MWESKNIKSQDLVLKQIIRIKANTQYISQKITSYVKQRECVMYGKCTELFLHRVGEEKQDYGEDNKKWMTER